MSTPMFGTTLSPVAEEAMGVIVGEIQAVEKVLAEAVCSQVPMVQQVGALTLEAGGKRLRPALVSLAAMATGLAYNPERTRRLGSCMELIHMATLIHDDVVDHATLRRGRPTAAHLFGNTASILSGDVLLAKAMCILADDGDLEIIRRVSRIVVDLAEGEVAECTSRGRLDLTEDEHFEILRRKTATFIEACCAVGGMCAGADASTIVALSTYGFHLGLAFQIVDDLLDYRGKSETLGKAALTDFREGCATLPLIRLMAACTDAERDAIATSFGDCDAEDDLSFVHDAMLRYGIFDSIETELQKHMQGALAPVEHLEGSGAKELLLAVTQFVHHRHA